MEKFIEAQVKAGNFASASDVLEAGLARLMLDPEADVLDDEQSERIEAAFDQVDRGEVVDGKGFHAYLRKKYLNEHPTHATELPR